MRVWRTTMKKIALAREGRKSIKTRMKLLAISKFRQRMMTVGLLISMAVSLAGCGAQKTTNVSKPTICVILKAMDSVTWLSVEDGLKQAAAEYDVNVNILWPSKENNIEAQNVILEDVIASEPDAIAVSPCDSEHMEIMGEAVKKGIPCFYIDTKSTSYAFPYIGADNRRMGEQGAEALAREVESGKIAIIMGNRRQSAHKERMEGFLAFFEKNPQFELYGVWEADASTAQESARCMEEILEQDPEIKGVFCTSAMMVLGAMKEQEQEGSLAKLVGVDMQSDAMTGIEGGKIQAMVGQNGFEIGYTTIRTIVQALQGKEIPEHTYVDTPLITQENVDKYMEIYLTERGNE